jgi:hypothetical protein
LFGHEPKFPASIRQDAMVVINTDDPNVRIHACEQRATLFRCALPMAMDNLVIAQHRDTLCCATIRGGGYWPQIQRFEQEDYVYLQ